MARQSPRPPPTQFMVSLGKAQCGTLCSQVWKHHVWAHCEGGSPVSVLPFLFPTPHPRVRTSWAVAIMGNSPSWRGWQALDGQLRKCSTARLRDSGARSGLASRGRPWQTPRLEQVYGRPRNSGVMVTARGTERPLSSLLGVGGRDRGPPETPRVFFSRMWVSSHLNVPGNVPHLQGQH